MQMCERQDFRIPVQLDLIVARVPVRHRPAQRRNAPVALISVRIRPGRRFLQRPDDLRVRRHVRTADAEVDHAPAPAVHLVDFAQFLGKIVLLGMLQPLGDRNVHVFFSILIR